ncbi:hypothetical protein EPR50_G00209320 [Perca flavescens]|uniref:Uncharacterized protein n=1 Tax=Perca flavescens TaxID=8167 RepID=A0A484CC08_PERFV|nr:hypothetical protein EPR50_G00209320 [Perca flavescens]
MGRRTIQVPEGACHKEITYLLCEVYFKMNELEGAWMLHKAMGGSGQRRLTLVSPDEMGYTGAGLFKSWGGKGCLYVMPIQHRLDMSPLPYTAWEFEAMPKARIPQSFHPALKFLMLKQHVQYVRSGFPLTLWKSTQAYVVKEFVMKLRRARHIRLKAFLMSSEYSMKGVTFLGETGIDNRALRKEFLTEMVAGIQSRFFVGGDNGKTPKYSMTDMDKHHFKTVGEILAVSIAQGGPPKNFFMDWCYNYMSSGELDQEAITEMAVTDPELIDLIQEIRAADNTSPDVMHRQDFVMWIHRASIH